jgi:Flp pilus assembly protein TadG
MRDKKGQVLIELALVLPLLMAFAFGIVDWGRALHAKNTLVNAARSGARVAAVTPNTSPEPVTPLASGSSNAASALAQSLSGLYDTVPTSLVYEVTILDASGNPISGAVQPGNQVQVSVTWQQFPMITPFHKLMALVTGGTAQANTLSLSGQAVMRYE